MSVSHAHPVAADQPSSWLRGVNLFFVILALGLVALAVAVKVWGMVALTMAALPFVPVMYIIFIWISLPKGV